MAAPTCGAAIVRLLRDDPRNLYASVRVALPTRVTQAMPRIGVV
ncbi:hypothetical protein HMPREF0682_2262 [Propionibacterium acidifaciens F0233]|uniref:Uncharacterized protein n=1 Tax=Propionibacterium acidifaciens F0233 TaxID=553198 RepID=U2QFR5_9ACTN|nr:hypothetical protein HMPREF0682_2262 [Propionibacterium acidifaciens F0233]